MQRSNTRGPNPTQHFQVTALLGFPSEKSSKASNSTDHLGRADVLFGETTKTFHERPHFVNLSKLYVLAKHQYACSTLLQHCFGYIFFLLIFAIVVMLQREAVVSSDLRSAIANRFLFAVFRDENTYELNGWLDVKDFHDLWTWHLGPFVEGFYQDTYENGKPRSFLDRQIAQVDLLSCVLSKLGAHAERQSPHAQP